MKALIPHAVNVEKLEHFQGVIIPVIIAQRKSIDILIGQTNKSLLAVLEERESEDPDHPNYVLTRFGPIASGDAWEWDGAFVETLKFKWTEIEMGVSVNNSNKKSPS